MLCSILSAIASILLLFVAGGLYFIIASGDYPSQWLAEGQGQDRPDDVRHKRARVDRSEESRAEDVGGPLLQVQQDLKRRRGRDAKTRTASVTKIGRKK